MLLFLKENEGNEGNEGNENQEYFFLFEKNICFGVFLFCH